MSLSVGVVSIAILRFNYELDGIPFRAWLYRIAHNTIVDHYRTTRNSEPLENHLHVRDEQVHLEQQVLVQEDTG